VARGRRIEQPSRESERHWNRSDAEYDRRQTERDIASTEWPQEIEDGIVERGVIVSGCSSDQLGETSVEELRSEGLVDPDVLRAQMKEAKSECESGDREEDGPMSPPGERAGDFRELARESDGVIWLARDLCRADTHLTILDQPNAKQIVEA